VVAYHPSVEFATNLTALRAQVPQVLVVDNGGGGAARRVEESGLRLEVCVNPANLGLAAGLNQGIDWARRRGCGFLATFDQDSHVTPGFVAAQLSAFAAFSQRDRVAIVSARLRDAAAGMHHSFTPPGAKRAAPYMTVPLAITSGNLVPLHVFDVLGRYREDFFIDYVDQEFCLRCRQRGWLILEVRDAMLDHRYGAPTRHRLGWMRPLVTNHAAVRRYYQSRNRLVVYRRYGRFDPCWLLADWKEFCRDTAKLVLFEKQRAAKLAAIARGSWDALRGRMGPAST